jgi:hypothetical protein
MGLSCSSMFCLYLFIPKRTKPGDGLNVSLQLTLCPYQVSSTVHVFIISIQLTLCPYQLILTGYWPCASTVTNIVPSRVLPVFDASLSIGNKGGTILTSSCRDPTLFSPICDPNRPILGSRVFGDAFFGKLARLTRTSLG